MRLFAGILGILAAVACGDEDKVRRLPDAPPPPDAVPDAPTSGAVTLTITSGEAPVDGIRVVFQAADGTVVSDTTTNASGKATATVEAGAYVTALDPLPIPQGVAQRDLRTFAGVKPGDQLVLHQDLGGNTISVNLVVPIDGGAGRYLLYTNCGFYDISGPGGSASEPGGQVFVSGCGTTTDLVVEARDFADVPIGSFFKADVTLQDGATIDLSAETYAAIPDSTFAYTNLPKLVTSMNLYSQLATTRGTLVELFDSAVVDSSTLTLTKKRPPAPGSTAVNISSFSGNTMTSHTVADWGPSASAYTLDVAAALLPSFASVPTLDAGAHTIGWTLGGGAVQPEFAHVTSYYTREIGGLLAWRWEIVAPTTTSVALPVLPADLAMFNPLADDAAFHEVELGKFPGGYDAVRATLMAEAQPLAIGATGRAVMARYVEAVLARAQPRASRTWPSAKTRVR